jgi:hypothetical protein
MAKVVTPRETREAGVRTLSGKGKKSVAFTDTLRVRELVEYLASDQLEGRESGSKGIEAAARYIESIFEENGVQKYFASYRDTLTTTKVPSFNIQIYI